MAEQVTTQERVYRAVCEGTLSEPSTADEIAERSFVSITTARRALRKLERAGKVARIHSEYGNGYLYTKGDK